MRPDSPIDQKEVAGEPLPRDPERSLGPILDRALSVAGEVLPTEQSERLEPVPPVRWSSRPVRSYLGIHRFRGQDRSEILVNQILRAPVERVPDEFLGFIVWHELMHHVLVGQGHDAEFYELESRWPEYERWSREAGSLHERWSLEPESYVTNNSASGAARAGS